MGGRTPCLDLEGTWPSFFAGMRMAGPAHVDDGAASERTTSGCQMSRADHPVTPMVLYIGRAAQMRFRCHSTILAWRSCSDFCSTGNDLRLHFDPAQPCFATWALSEQRSIFFKIIILQTKERKCSKQVL